MFISCYWRGLYSTSGFSTFEPFVKEIIFMSFHVIGWHFLSQISLLYACKYIVVAIHRVLSLLVDFDFHNRRGYCYTSALGCYPVIEVNRNRCHWPSQVSGCYFCRRRPAIIMKHKHCASYNFHPIRGIKRKQMKFPKWWYSSCHPKRNSN